MEDEIKDKAIYYWQDKLAKFFPKAKKPTGSEIDMFRAGYLTAGRDKHRAELDAALEENKRLQQELVDSIMNNPHYKLIKELKELYLKKQIPLLLQKLKDFEILD